MGTWLDRTAVTVGLAFVAGIAVAVIVFVVVYQMTKDDGGDSSPPQPTATVAATVETPTVAQTPGVTTTSAAPTPTAGQFTVADDALANFVQRELQGAYIGPCTDTSTGGVCSVELYRSDQLVAFFVGPAQSEGLGEAVLTKSDDGTWSVQFLLAPPPGSTIAVGQEAVVYGAGDCLRFREEPRLAGKELSCQPDGNKSRVIAGPVEADGIAWWQLDGLGWASGQYLVPAAQ